MPASAFGMVAVLLRSGCKWCGLVRLAVKTREGEDVVVVEREVVNIERRRGDAAGEFLDAKESSPPHLDAHVMLQPHL